MSERSPLTWAGLPLCQKIYILEPLWVWWEGHKKEKKVKKMEMEELSVGIYIEEFCLCL